VPCRVDGQKASAPFRCARTVVSIVSIINIPQPRPYDARQSFQLGYLKKMPDIDTTVDSSYAKRPVKRLREIKIAAAYRLFN
jgi:hypothetical protein